MNRHGLSRIAAVVVGAAVLFGLEQGLEAPLYIAIPAGVAAYLVTLVARGLWLGNGARAK
jgi:hypothetical protein